MAAGARRGLTLAQATMLARDLANSPPAHLTASRIADVATVLGARAGLGVEVFDRDDLVRLGCGGLIGVNGGSTDEPRMVKLMYRPAAGHAASHLALVAKGITYDSGGISLKPADAVHATMKNDMTGAAAVLAAMLALRELGCRTTVTGYLMCTDNLPSGSALKLGDVITIHGGTTVEVLNTDAEGRLVMADALVMAAEQRPDAIVDIATLTGACMRALGTKVAGVPRQQPAAHRPGAPLGGRHVSRCGSCRSSAPTGASWTPRSPTWPTSAARTRARSPRRCSLRSSPAGCPGRTWTSRAPPRWTGPSRG